MKQSDRGGYTGKSWKELERIIALGYDRGRVFSDWLELMLAAYLSATDNIYRNNRDKWDGPYEARYMEIVGRYASNREIGARPIDRFSAAMAELHQEMADDADILGEIFMMEITYGEHGQFYTPEALTRVMAAMTMDPDDQEPRTISDPACGSGRTLIAAHEINPRAMCHAVDLDPRCAKMCALNFLFRGIKGDVYCGNTITNEMYTLWRVRGTWITEHDMPPAPKQPDEPEQLALL